MVVVAGKLVALAVLSVEVEEAELYPVKDERSPTPAMPAFGETDLPSVGLAPVDPGCRD